ncbi:MAG TPA: UDP-N-acetylmuramoyl-L-alanyl-D-glutamate--2,6-diaminopimelate ligase [Candidatus Paceibacterota bacterium]|nr:UDP-N-acetylmuramoyl-L-alanyl-D-glutamate--2,6-diaminopimelate ligase [Candidatus Paceibacterota bacterium]
MERPILSLPRSLNSIAIFLGVPLPTNDVSITGLSHASNEIIVGDLFIALPGAKTHGAIFSLDAKNRGAKAILTDSVGAEIASELPVLVVENPRRIAGILSAWFYREPMREMFCVGITGTNGKTTTTTLLHQIWRGTGHDAGLIGTVETRIGAEVIKSTRTTPESPDIQSLMSIMHERHINRLAMEVSSHALVLERIRGSHFSAVAFSNLSQDHLDFHQSMEEYFQAKASLFTFEYSDVAIINIDDPYGARLASDCEIQVVRVSRNDVSADWHYVSASPQQDGFDVLIRGVGGVLIEGMLALHGEFNLDNALMAVALAYQSGVDPIVISTLLPTLTGARGRLESVNVGQPFAAFIDYAHSPDSVERVLQTCKTMTSGRVIAVLGCGGDRDKSKRPIMGRALLNGSHVAVFTSDNPRSEDPDEILKDMTSNLSIGEPSRVITDRQRAIEYAVSLAGSDDLVIVLGKGHEIGQEIAGAVFPFDDKLVMAAAIEGRS